MMTMCCATLYTTTILYGLHNCDLWTLWCITTTYGVYCSVRTALPTVYYAEVQAYIYSYRCFWDILGEVDWDTGRLDAGHGNGFADVEAFVRVQPATMGAALHRDVGVVSLYVGLDGLSR